MVLDRDAKTGAISEILKMAGDRNADLIVLDVQGRGSIDLMLFGSNSARVTRNATCATLVVPVRMTFNRETQVVTGPAASRT
jgi:nucleotide-binding universal stress UspA family protein